MKRILTLAGLLLLLTLGLQANPYRIQVRETSLRASASAFGTRLGNLSFNTPVQVIGESGGFYQVSTPLGNGFVTKSALASQSAFDGQYVNVRSTSGYSQDAVTAATKGFSDVEVQAARKPGARYDLVEQAIRFSGVQRDDSWWAAFRQEGYLGENKVMIKNKGYRK